MAKKKFNPKDWLEQPKPKEVVQPTVKVEHPVEDADIENILQQIESKQVDITSTYTAWRDIGFAFADAFGESGRDYFHRISSFYQGYSGSDCNEQYDKCLKSKGHGVTMATFYFYAKNAGIKLPGQEDDDNRFDDSMPTFQNVVYSNLPEFLQKAISIATSDEERDILLLGSIVSLSSCLQRLYGIYDGKKVYPNLYLFVTARASAGKGRLVHCKQLVKPVHTYLREQAKLLKQQHDLEMMDYKERKGQDSSTPKPAKPPEKMLFIPANNSATGVYQLLFENESRGLIFETEGDTLAQAFKSDYGNYSEGFRKAFHHETISYYRRTDREYADLDAPCLSTVLSGTPRQIATLIPNAENGLFSRFIFYFMNIQPTWKNVFAFGSDNGLDDFFDTLGAEFYKLYQMLASNPEIQFVLTAEQQEQFNKVFSQIQVTYLGLQGLDYIATVRRLGLIAFRMCIILSALRIMEHGELPIRMVCENRDFQTVMSMVQVLIQHSSKVFSELPEEPELPKRKNQKEKFYDQLPANFNRQAYLKLANEMSIPEKTAEGYITGFCKKGLLHREKQDHYLKPDKA